jgi:hypothetical protein
LGERRACLVALVRVASYRWGRVGPRDAQSFGQSRTLRIKQLLGVTGSTGWFDLAVPTAPIVPSAIFIVFRGPQAYLNSCEKSSHTPRHFSDATKNLRVSYVLSVLNFDPIFARVSSARWTSNQRLNLL